MSTCSPTGWFASDNVFIVSYCSYAYDFEGFRVSNSAYARIWDTQNEDL